MALEDIRRSSFKDLESPVTHDGLYSDRVNYKLPGNSNISVRNISLFQWHILYGTLDDVINSFEYNKNVKSKEEFKKMLNYVSDTDINSNYDSNGNYNRNDVYYNPSRYSTLMFAIVYRHCIEDRITVVRLLIKEGINVNTFEESTMGSIINNTIFWNLDEELIDPILTMLIDAKIDLNNIGHNGFSVLYNLMFLKNRDKLEYYLDKLINAGANINIVDFRNNSTLMNMCCYSYSDENLNQFKQKYMSLLLKYKNIDLNIQSRDGDTALHYAVYNSKPFTELLIKAGANMNIKNNINKTCISIIIDYYFDNISSYTHFIKDDWNLLYYENLELLINNGADYYLYKDNIIIDYILNNNRIKQLEQKNEQQEQEIEKLKKENALLQAKLDFQPGGPGFYEAQTDFIYHASN